MHKMKVLLAIRPRLLSAVVRHLVARQPDMEVVSEVMNLSEIGAALRATAVEVVILTPADTGKEPETCSQLWVESPHLRILTLSATGDTALYHASDSTTTRIEEVSAEALLSAIRAFRC
jgi:DNA-binding NarL/FixJ family response regulator